MGEQPAETGEAQNASGSASESGKSSEENEEEVKFDPGHNPLVSFESVAGIPLQTWML